MPSAARELREPEGNVAFVYLLHFHKASKRTKAPTLCKGAIPF